MTQVDMAYIHQVDPSCGIPYHTQDLVTSESLKRRRLETTVSENQLYDAL